MRRAAVLGHPVGHSLSPVLHRAAYAALGLHDWVYDRRDVTAEQLPAALAELDPSWAGLSLTMPLKSAVLGLVDHVEPLARVVGAANTVLVDPAGRPSVAANTDVHGLVTALQEVGVSAVSAAVVLGAGATAASALAALAQLGAVDPVVCTRSVRRAGPLLAAAHRMGVHPTLRPLRDALTLLADAELVISTIPGAGADPLAARLTEISVSGVLLDARYGDRPSPLLTGWQAAGGTGVGGERLLLHQATEQVRLMTGLVAPLAQMDAALQLALAHG